MDERRNYKPVDVCSSLDPAKPRASGGVGDEGRLGEGCLLASADGPDSPGDVVHKVTDVYAVGTPVTFDIAPAREQRGTVWGYLDIEGIRFWMLRYVYGSDQSLGFVVREEGQFRVVR